MFEWHDRLSTGHRVIDEQNKELFRIGRRLNQVLSESKTYDRKDEIVECLHRLKDYAAHHFRTEELFFETYRYSRAREHILEHHSFMQELDRFIAEPEKRGCEDAVIDLLTYTAQWMDDHISNQDLGYPEFFKNQIRW